MKTQTFIKEVEQLGFYTLTDGKDIYIFDREISEEELYYEDDTYAIATIGTDEYKDFVIKGKFIDKDTDVTKTYNLFKLIMEYTNTPVEDRESENKYYICSRLIPDSDFKYLCKRCGSIDELEFDVESNIDSKFTQKEIDDIKRAFDTDLKDFKIIKVKECKD